MHVIVNIIISDRLYLLSLLSAYLIEIGRLTLLIQVKHYDVRRLLMFCIVSFSEHVYDGLNQGENDYMEPIHSDNQQRKRMYKISSVAGFLIERNSVMKYQCDQNQFPGLNFSLPSLI